MGMQADVSQLRGSSGGPRQQQVPRSLLPLQLMRPSRKQGAPNNWGMRLQPRAVAGNSTAHRAGTGDG